MTPAFRVEEKARHRYGRPAPTERECPGPGSSHDSLGLDSPPKRPPERQIPQCEPPSFTCRLRVACEQACIGAFAFYLIGFGFAYDNDGNANGFIGAGKSTFALSGSMYDHETTENGSAPSMPPPRPEPEPQPEPEREPEPEP